MIRPLLDQYEREFLRHNPEHGTLRWTLAIAGLKQAFGKSWIIQRFIKPIVEQLSQALN